jgi:hypothetical protein
MKKAANASLFLVVSLWLVAVFSGTVLLWRYKSTPGAVAAPSAIWPIQSALSLAQSQPTIVMFAHPYCPCTAASLSELSVLRAVEGGARVYILFVAIDSDGPVEESNNWKRATAMEGVSVLRDPDGALSRLFDAKTSGQVMIYAPSRELLFSGGITAARGHEGDNIGLDRAIALIRREPTESTTSPVFGCSLF